MKLRMLMGAVAMTAVVAGAAAALSLQERDKPTGMDPKMAKVIEAGTPGEGHKALEPCAGKWDLKVKHFEKAGAPPVESNATSEVKWIMDGRFLEEVVKGSMMDMPFEGKGVIGYDNTKKKYVSSWIDNMSTGIMFSEGTYDPATKTSTSTGECADPVTGKLVKHRMVRKAIDNDHWTMQMFMPGEDGKEYMGMEIIGARSSK